MIPVAEDAACGSEDTGTVPYPHHLVERVRLADGTRLTVRPLCADDYELEVAFLRGLSRRSAYQRLMSTRILRRDEVRRLVTIDYGRELALAAVVPFPGQPRLIGVARYAPQSDAGACEVAIVVADAWQGRGLGEILMRSLVGAAKLARVPVLDGVTFATNSAMLRLAAKIGFRLHRDPGDATVTQITLQLIRTTPR